VSRIVRLGAVAAAALLLAGCVPVAPTPTLDAASSSAPSPTPTTTAAPAPAPESADPASFLLQGTPGVPDADGLWSGHYGFFTDASKSVRCDLYIFSGDSGGAICAITLGNEELRTYTVPADVPTDCDLSASNASDGYSVAINFKVFETGSAGFSGCRSWLEQMDPAILAATKVLPENQTLTVESASESFTCTVTTGVADCSEASSGASIRFGTGVAEFQG
jgi:hypothetical protein